MAGCRLPRRPRTCRSRTCRLHHLSGARAFCRFRTCRSRSRRPRARRPRTPRLRCPEAPLCRFRIRRAGVPFLILHHTGEAHAPSACEGCLNEGFKVDLAAHGRIHGHGRARLQRGEVALERMARLSAAVRPLRSGYPVARNQRFRSHLLLFVHTPSIAVRVAGDLEQGVVR